MGPTPVVQLQSVARGIHKAPKSKIRNPESRNRTPKSKIQNPKSEIQNPKSEILTSKAQNPKSKIPRKIQNLGRGGPHIKNCYITIQNPKSRKSGRKSLDFGLANFDEFWILDSGFWILGRSRGCSTRQYSDGALRSEARIPPGPSLAASLRATKTNCI